MAYRLRDRDSIYDETLTRTGQPSSRLVYHKVCLTGSLGVGKTSFFLTVKYGEFPEGKNLTSLGVDTYDMTKQIDGEFVGLSMNDTLGIERCGTLTATYFKGASCILFLFSVEDQYSLEALDDAVKETKAYATSRSCLLYLVATKIDLFSDISQERMEEKRIELNCAKLFLISSKTGEGVNELMDDVARTLKENTPISTIPAFRLQPEELDNRQEQKAKCSC